MNRVILAVGFVVMLLPIWLMGVGSLQDIHGVLRMPPQLWPRQATVGNYAWVLTHPIVRWALNTAIVTASAVIGSVVVCVAAGYVFAFFALPCKRVLWTMLLLGIMVPRMSMIIPVFVVVRKLGLSGTLWAAFLPYVLSPMSLHLARAFFETVPRSLLESARIDGAGDLRVLTSIVAPISKPIVALTAVFAATGAMGNFLWQMLQLQRPEVRTLIVGLVREMMRAHMGEMPNPLGQSMAVGVVLLIPMLAVFLSANKYFIGGLKGAVKE